jgi:ubiquinone/menaquinone biosynthesis C-methylase UbiE
MAEAPPKAAVRGQPSYVWRAGQERRLALIRRHVALENARILDVGCGIGTYVRRPGELSPEVYGIDIELDHLKRGSLSLPNLVLAASEHMPFRTESFDVVLLNEVIEHVSDDAQTLREATSVARPGGKIVVYAPNRLYPFETHGVFIGGRYVFGNIPFVNYLPSFLRRRLAPHVRAYTKRNLRSLTRAVGASWAWHTVVYPGFDNISARSRMLGGALRAILYRLEKTPFRAFGLSHLLILEKGESMGKGAKDG